jgi:hypothetical protein
MAPAISTPVGPPPMITWNLKTTYRAFATGELSPQLLALSKKLDEELLKKQDQ